MVYYLHGIGKIPSLFYCTHQRVKIFRQTFVLIIFVWVIMSHEPFTNFTTVFELPLHKNPLLVYPFEGHDGNKECQIIGRNIVLQWLIACSYFTIQSVDYGVVCQMCSRFSVRVTNCFCNDIFWKHTFYDVLC